MIRTAESPDVFGNTIFCDDIRHEIDGKVSFIGAYMGGLQVHTPFPATIPKFGFSITLYQRRSVFQGKLSLRIYFPEDEDDKPSVETQLDDHAPPDEPSEPTTFIALKSHIVLLGMVLKAAGTIKVRALLNDTLYPLGSLPIAQGQIPEEPAKEPT